MSTTSRHRRPSPVGLLPIIGLVIVGAVLGAGAMTLVTHMSPALPTSPRQGISAGAASSSTAPPRSEPHTGPSSTVPSDTGLSNNDPQQDANPVRQFNRLAFAAPSTDAAGMSLTVLRPEKIKGGVRFTISLVNTNDIPITVDTGALGPHEPQFNNVSVPMSMTPVRKQLVPGEGYTYQCSLKLPSMDVGQVAFTVGNMNVAGQAAGD